MGRLASLPFPGIWYLPALSGVEGSAAGGFIRLWRIRHQGWMFDVECSMFRRIRCCRPKLRLRRLYATAMPVASASGSESVSLSIPVADLL